MAKENKNGCAVKKENHCTIAADTEWKQFECQVLFQHQAPLPKINKKKKPTILLMHLARTSLILQANRKKQFQWKLIKIAIFPQLFSVLLSSALFSCNMPFGRH